MARQTYIKMKSTLNEGVGAGQGVVHNFTYYASYFVIAMLTISLVLYIHRCRTQYAFGSDSITSKALKRSASKLKIIEFRKAFVLTKYTAGSQCFLGQCWIRLSLQFSQHQAFKNPKYNTNLMLLQ